LSASPSLVPATPVEAQVARVPFGISALCLASIEASKQFWEIQRLAKLGKYIAEDMANYLGCEREQMEDCIQAVETNAKEVQP
jgi:hypothetical protein